MHERTSEQLRNIAIMGHGSTGKTMLSEALLFASGALSRMGSVEQGNTVSDFDEQEHAHHYSVSTALVPVRWGEAHVNVLDTPGYPDFLGEVVAAATAADAALITVDASAGVQSGTETAWRVADQAGLPRIVAVTRMDREHADFNAALASLRRAFGDHVVPLAIPIGSGDSFEGVAGLMRQHAALGAAGEEGPVPPELEEALAEAREMLVAAVAESDDTLLEKYVDGQEIAGDELAAALAEGVRNGGVVPVVPVSTNSQVGVRYLLDRIVELMPSPAGRAVLAEEGEIVCDADGPPVVHVFKTTADPFVGKLTFFRVLSGTLTTNAHLWNGQRRTEERFGHLNIARGKELTEVPSLVAGEIGVVSKLTATVTGDTLTASEASAVTLPPMPFPVPTYRSGLHPRSQDDVDRLSSALARLTEQDPTIRVDRDPDTHELLLTTIGDVQANVTAARLASMYGVAVDLTVPRVPYRETVSTTARAEYRHKKQTGGHGQFGHVVLEITPRLRGEGFAFHQRVVGGAVPKQFIPAVEKGIIEALPNGPLADCPLVDLQVTLLDGSAHPVDSSEMAFKIAASQALKQAVLAARPVLLEPIMRLEIQVPSEYVGDVMSDLGGRRGQAHGVDPRGAISVIEAHAPLAEVQHYAIDLRTITQGRGSFTIEFDHYAETPPPVQEQVLQRMDAVTA